MRPDIHFKLLHGAEIAPYLEELAALRLSVFHEFPYLYEGSKEYEERYLGRYVAQPEAGVVIAFDHDKVIGAATGMPLMCEEEAFQNPFLKAGVDVSTGYYFAESVLLPAYRGQGIGKNFFQYRHRMAERSGPFAFYTFCAVQRPDDHPKKPEGYRSLKPFWTQQGFEETEFYTQYSWQDRDESIESEKTMRFWWKWLNADLENHD